MAQRLGVNTYTCRAAALLYRRTAGNALFVVQLLDHLLQQGWLVEVDGQWHLRDGVAAVAK